ncbi:MAG: hypothetical protein PQJ46_05700, partial [Spirochaetales bacterium]|nr:hypothetical protein [Spirochaetales bacterium]
MSDDSQIDLKQEEKEEILEELNEMVASNRIKITKDKVKITPKKNGLGLPLLINFLAIAAVASTFIFSTKLFEQKQEDLRIETKNYQSAEGKLLAELKKQTEAQMAQKDEEIHNIQSKMDELNKKSEELAKNMEQEIKQHEIEMQEALEAELEKERKKLQAEGRSEAYIQEQLQELERQRHEEYQAELAAFRAESEREIAERQRELEQAKQLNQQLLEEMNQERERLKKEAEEREKEIAANQQENDEKTSSAEEEMKQLALDMEKESLILDQINGSYKAIFTAINNGNLEEALTQIESLQHFINDPTISVLKNIANRRQNDINILSKLKTEIESELYKSEADTENLAEAADLLMSARQISALGDQEYSANNFDKAGEYYDLAIKEIPAIKKAWTRLNSLSKTDEERRLSNYLQNGDSLNNSGKTGEAVEEYKNALSSVETKNPGLLEESLNKLLTALNIQHKKTLDDTNKKYQKDLKNTENNYEKQLSETKAKAENELAESTSEYESRITNIESELEAARNEITDKTEKLNQSIADGTKSREEIESLNLEIEDLKKEYIEKVAEAEKSNYEKGMTDGRLSAFTDVMAFTSMLDGTTEVSMQARSEIENRKGKESAYDETVSKIMALSQAGAVESAMDLVETTKSILIGSVSFTSGNRIVIEPFTNLNIKNGETLIIKRKEQGKPEQYITTAEVVSA